MRKVVQEEAKEEAGEAEKRKDYVDAEKEEVEHTPPEIIKLG